MVGTGHGRGVHWSSKAVRVVLEAVEGRISTVQNCHIARMMKLRFDAMIFGRFCWGFEKMMVPSSVKEVFRGRFRTYWFSLLKVSM